ncbi:glycosyltransferase family 4 protein [Thermosyntropha sp.]|uniref:glycosyltransferase family 4 protein n=1 Tax=Thermosyntropha sp. TaxID=2740820 RepID=UPI0025D75C80|nr:glycosyltransferase family 4 protein [Thermosyntropha sp.]MBO8159710.1 glycosyltransferase family 4 protein [Thermosyntropha sp.]
MNKRVLFTATVDSHILHFHLPYIKWFKEQGFEVHVASRGGGEIPFADVKHEILFERSPFKLPNIKAYRQLKKIIEENDYTLIHCHTPVGGVLTRLAARNARKKGTKVLYTAHGFHFFKGAPLRNWLLYYPLEKWLARYTECLITINEEDYQRAIKGNFKAGTIKKVDGVGIDLTRFKPVEEGEKNNLRQKYGYKENDFILICVGELNANKHQDLLIKAVKVLKYRIPEVKLLLVGTGKLENKYKRMAKKLGVEEHVHFLGYRNDVPDLMAIADAALSASKREGLPVNIMEAMATGLPLVVTDCRGSRDLVEDGENGFVVGVDDVRGIAEAVEKIYWSEEIKEKFRANNLEKIKSYSLNIIKKEMVGVYMTCL